ncbi:MAG: hypothetical protein MJY88_08295 [Bacteroidales bacterium]|nr:hypothetical protein [Bacteroidales bacterium]
MIYRRFIRPIIFKLQPKRAQTLALTALEFFRNFFLTRKLVKLIYGRRRSGLQTESLGILFPNPIGFAAGFDKNGRFCDVISDLGFGFIEFGPITPKPESGTDISNDGLLATIANLKDRRPKTIIAANIVHNSSTSDEMLVADYDKSFSLLYDFADMFVINASEKSQMKRSPMEDPEILSEAMDVVLDRRLTMDKMKPVLVKVSPDIPYDQLDSILSYSMASGVDGIVAGDVNKNNVNQFEKNLELVKHIDGYCKGRLDIIACGGVLTPEEAAAMLDAGASLVELYTGLFYEGPHLVKHTLKYLENR